MSFITALVPPYNMINLLFCANPSEFRFDKFLVQSKSSPIVPLLERFGEPHKVIFVTDLVPIIFGKNALSQSVY